MSAQPRLLPALETRLARHRGLVLAVLVAAGAALRLVTFAQADAGPLLLLHRLGINDMNHFDGWARAIAAGDLLTDRPLHPHHGWHDAVARSYFALHPEDPLAREAAEPGTAKAAARRLWDRWHGGKRFHQEPLYPYLVALTYAVFGPDPRWVFLWQMLVGIGTTLLVYVLARRFFGELTAVLAALLVTFCGPVFYYELTLKRTTLVTFGSLGLLWLGLRAREEGGLSRSFLTGLGSGLLLLAHTITAPLVLSVAAMPLAVRAPLSDRLRRGAAMAAGLAVALSPLVARNLAVGVSPLATGSVSAIGFVCTNAADFPPEAGYFISGHLARIFGETGGAFLPTVVATMKTHDGPASVARQLGGKLVSAWHWYEKPNNTNYYLFRELAPALESAPVTFSAVGPLALVGLLASARQWRRIWPLQLLVAASLVPLLVFYTLSRLRTPLFAALLVFAAYALAAAAGAALEKRFGVLATLAGATAVAWVALHRPLPITQPLIRVDDHIALYLVQYRDQARAAEARADWGGTAAVYEEFLRSLPEQIRALSPSRPPLTLAERDGARMYAPIYQSYARALAAAGRTAEAATAASRASELERFGRFTASP